MKNILEISIFKIDENDYALTAQSEGFENVTLRSNHCDTDITDIIGKFLEKNSKFDFDNSKLSFNFDFSEALKDYLPTVMYFKCKTAEDFQKAEDYLIEEKIKRESYVMTKKANNFCSCPTCISKNKIKESESYFRDLYNNTLKEKEKGSDDLVG